MMQPTLLGQVIFFNVKRGFGRLRSDEHAEGVFVHFSAIEDDSRVLIPNELVRYEARWTSRGARAERVQRLSPRFRGRLVFLTDEEGEIVTPGSTVRYRWHLEDWLSTEGYAPEVGAAVEFSPFEEQAKEVVITDPRRPLPRFASLSHWSLHLSRLAKRLAPSVWCSKGPEDDHLALDHYVHHTFIRVQAEGKVVEEHPAQRPAIAAFHTGLFQADGQALYAVFGPNQQPYHGKSTLPRPVWQLTGFFPEGHQHVANISGQPQRAYYHQHPGQLMYDPALPLEVDVEELLGQEIERFPEAFQRQSSGLQVRKLTEALTKTRRRLTLDYKLAVPVYHHERVRLVLPIWLSDHPRPDIGLLISQDGVCYYGVGILTAEEVGRWGRLIAPIQGHPHVEMIC